MKIKGFFQDANGDLSMMRLLVFIIVVSSSSCFVAEIVYCLFVGSFENHLTQIIAFATLGLGAKYAQKQTEK
tara:strand:+ start:3163 stop:3378 length:216 start_codon:yes stop_codon:yes gene_type:complete